MPKDALNIDKFDEQHKVDCYFDHSLTLKLVEFFLLAEKFLPQAEIRRAELGKLAFIQKSKDSLDSEPLPFELISQALDRTSPHAPLCTLILDYVSSDYLAKNSFMTRIRDELLEAFKDRQTNNDYQKETRHHNPEQVEESVARSALKPTISLRETDSEMDPTAKTRTQTDEGDRTPGGWTRERTSLRILQWRNGYISDIARHS